jgi:hypothetical protein
LFSTSSALPWRRAGGAGILIEGRPTFVSPWMP